MRQIVTAMLRMSMIRQDKFVIHHSFFNLAAVRDSSGLRLTYTSQIRTYDAGMLEVGHDVSTYRHVVPPNAETYLNTGECMSECIGQVSVKKTSVGDLVFKMAFQLHEM